MPDPSTYRPATGSIPESPGVYRFRDERGRVVYVGKAKNLRSRLNSYFADPAGLHPRTYQMVNTAAGVDWVVVTTEVEALQLEYSWIKEYDPRFNVRYRDDKSYPSLAVTLHEEYPRLMVMRGPKRKGVRYFGPYSHAWAIRETLDLLLRVFPARTCSAGVFKRAGQIGRPCLLGYIGKCSAPCVDRVSAEEHRRIVEDFCDFMAGKTDKMTRRLEKEMTAAAADLDFERAARLRDDIGALRRAMEKQSVVFSDGTDADVVAFAEDQLEAAVQVFHVRGGRVRGQRGWVTEKVSDVDTADLVERFCEQIYGDETPEAVPREVLVPSVPEDAEAMSAWLTGIRGSRVSVRVPQRGDKRALMETVRRNAEQALAQHKLKRAGDLTTRSKALAEIAEYLGLDDAPLRIECFDISHVQGSDTVGSMVVFEDGVQRKSEYRRFAVRGRLSAGRGDGDGGGSGVSAVVPAENERGPDDTAAMAEVLRRRFSRYLAETTGNAVAAESAESVGPTGPAGPAGSAGASAPAGEAGSAGEAGAAGGAGLAEQAGLAGGAVDAGTPPGIDPETGRPKKFAYPPNLLVVDGGAPQVSAAAAVLSELGITDVALCGLAKRLEEVWLPGEEYPVIMPRTSEGLYLLQRIRDEAHRFAITYHRQKRSKRMTSSALDGIPGLGEARRKALLRRFGSVKRLRTASIEEISEVPGIGVRLAETIQGALAPAKARPGGVGETDENQPDTVGEDMPAFNAATGEIIEPDTDADTTEVSGTTAVPGTTAVSDTTADFGTTAGGPDQQEGQP